MEGYGNKSTEASCEGGKRESIARDSEHAKAKNTRSKVAPSKTWEISLDIPARIRYNTQASQEAFVTFPTPLKLQIAG